MPFRLPCLAWLFAVSACSVGELDLANRECPCVEGYRCNMGTNTCEPLAGDGGSVRDTGLDTAMVGDTSMDGAPVDSGLLDSGVADGAPVDTGPVDTGPVDTGPEDTGPVDTGPVDTGVLTMMLPIDIDTYVDVSMPTVSFATSNVLLVDSDPIAYETYIQPVDPGLPSGTEIMSATLEIVCTNIGDDVEVRAVTTAWDASTTWDSRPTTDPSPITTYTPALGTVSIDVTALVQDWVDGAPNHGIALVTAGTDGSDYHSTEAGAARNRPRLTITYAP